MKKHHQFVLAIAAASLVLAGCGGSGSGTKDSGGSSAVGKDAGIELTKANFASTIAAAQRKAKSSHVAMSVAAGGQKITAGGDVVTGATPAETEVAMKMDMAAAGVGQLEMRLVDSVFYVNLGPMSQNKFAKIDLGDSSNPIASQYGAIVDQLDPSKQIAEMQQALTAVTKKGDAISLDGVKAQPYEVTLDTSKIASLKKLGASAGANIPKTVTYTMWVGPDNLPRRFVTDVAGSPVTMNYTKWGENFNISAPSKDEIATIDLNKMLGQAPKG